jgi:hypothetical protein
MRKYRAAMILAIICSLGAVGVPNALASAEYFYNDNVLGEYEEVSSATKATLYEVAAYTNETKGQYCVEGDYTNGLGISGTQVCGNGVKSVITTFGAQEGRGVLENGGPTRRFTAEIRW